MRVVHNHPSFSTLALALAVYADHVRSFVRLIPPFDSSRALGVPSRPRVTPRRHVPVHPRPRARQMRVYTLDERVREIPRARRRVPRRSLRPLARENLATRAPPPTSVANARRN